MCFDLNLSTLPILDPKLMMFCTDDDNNSQNILLHFLVLKNTLIIYIYIYSFNWFTWTKVVLFYFIIF